MRTEMAMTDTERAKSNYLDALYLLNLSPEFKQLLERARAESRKLNRDGISVSLGEAYLISEQVRLSASKNFIELGSLTGYSALFILRGLSNGGQLYCFEKDDRCADFLEALFSDLSGIPELESKRVSVIRGDARESLRQWSIPNGIGGAFIDANKAAYLDYLNWIETHLAGRYLIIADNVFLGGAVWGQKETPYSEKQVQIMNEFNKKLISSHQYESFFVGTSEGLLIARKKN